MERCRCCLQLLVELSNNLVCMPNLRDMYTSCTSLAMLPSDDYPKCICHDCAKQLLAFNQFRSLCNESLKRFNEIVQSKQALRMITADEQADFDPSRANQTEIVVAVFEAKSLNVTTNAERNLDSAEQVSQAQTANLDAAEDGWCTEAAPPTIIATDNMPQRKERKSEVRTKRQRQDKTGMHNLKCSNCAAQFAETSLLAAHQCKHDTSTSYACYLDNCKFVFLTPYALTEHLKAHEHAKPLYMCTENGCKRVYKHKPTLIMHMRKYHKCGPEPKSHICEICGKIFKSSSILNDHRYTHKDKSELPYACDKSDCRLRFSNKEKLKVHMLRHAGIKKYVCPHCGMRKTTRNELNVHINYHTLERTWPCRFCSKVCNSAGNLRMHVRTVHEQAKDYACRYCERRFAKADTRKYHEMTHTGERPHQCKVCGKRFTQPAALRTHRKIHLRDATRNSAADAISNESVDVQSATQTVDIIPLQC